MKDWKLALVTWSKNNFNKQPAQTEVKEFKGQSKQQLCNIKERNMENKEKTKECSCSIPLIYSSLATECLRCGGEIK